MVNFIVRTRTLALNIRAVLAVTRSITYPSLPCVHSFHSILIVVDLGLSVLHFCRVLHAFNYWNLG